MTARSPAEVFANASTVIESGGGQKPRIVTTFPDIDTAHEAAALLTKFVAHADLPAAPGAGSAAPVRVDLCPGMEEAIRSLEFIAGRMEKGGSSEIARGIDVGVSGLRNHLAALYSGAAAVGPAAGVVLVEPHDATEEQYQEAARICGLKPTVVRIAYRAVSGVIFDAAYSDDDQDPHAASRDGVGPDGWTCDPDAAAPPCEAVAAEGTAAGPGGDGDLGEVERLIRQLRSLDGRFFAAARDIDRCEGSAESVNWANAAEDAADKAAETLLDAVRKALRRIPGGAADAVLEDLRRLSEAATPGEWSIASDEGCILGVSTNEAVSSPDVILSPAYSDRPHGEDQANMRLAVRLVNDLRARLARGQRGGA